MDLNPNDIDRIEVIKGAAAAAIYGSRANNGVVQIFTKKGREGKPQISFSTQVKSSSLGQGEFSHKLKQNNRTGCEPKYPERMVLGLIPNIYTPI